MKTCDRCHQHYPTYKVAIGDLADFDGEEEWCACCRHKDHHNWTGEWEEEMWNPRYCFEKYGYPTRQQWNNW